MHFCIYKALSAKKYLQIIKGLTEVSGKQVVNISEKGSNVQLSNYHNQFEAPFVIYADFEFSLKENPNLIGIILLSLILIIIKSVLLVVMVTQLVVCIADSISQLVNTYPRKKTVYRFIEKKCLKKVSIVEKLLKNTLRKRSLLIKKTKDM